MDCSGSYGNLGCSGGGMSQSFSYATANGICSEASYGYTGVASSCRSSSCITSLPLGDVLGYKSVTSNSYSALLSAVNQQPVSVAIEADQSIFQLYTGGVISASSCGSNLDHAVLLVGFGSSGTNYWLVKNSWGTSWGVSGYAMLQRSGVTGPDTCGIQLTAVHPVVKARRLRERITILV